MRYRTLSAILLIAASTAGAQSKYTPSSKAQQEIVAIDKQYWDAVNRCDEKTWDRLTSEDLLYITAPGHIKDKELSRIDHFTLNLPCGNTTYIIEPVVVRVFGDTAISIGNFGLNVAKDGTRRYLTNTRVYRRERGAWRVVSIHHSNVEKKIMIDANGDLVQGPIS